jgi:hypothetical protein
MPRKPKSKVRKEEREKVYEEYAYILDVAEDGHIALALTWSGDQPT